MSRRIEIKFSYMFVLIIFGILRYFELKMIVLGGVVIGSINV